VELALFCLAKSACFVLKFGVMLRVCRFKTGGAGARVGLLQENGDVLDLTDAGVTSLTSLLEMEDAGPWLRALIGGRQLDRKPSAKVHLLCPVERQEVWGAGVTYQPSQTARMQESAHSASCYERVYKAERPELFFKSAPDKVVGPGDAIGIRDDSRWTVPEPELALVLHSRGRVAGYTIGNDVSARDIEGENPLYLPQAKIYHRSCAVGPAILLEASESTARTWRVDMTIRRQDKMVFDGTVDVERMYRRFDELAKCLFHCQRFPQGVVLMTGTGIVPPPGFALLPGDRVAITVDPIGVLENAVEQV